MDVLSSTSNLQRWRLGSFDTWMDFSAINYTCYTILIQNWLLYLHKGSEYIPVEWDPCDMAFGVIDG